MQAIKRNMRWYYFYIKEKYQELTELRRINTIPVSFSMCFCRLLEADDDFLDFGSTAALGGRC